MNSYNLYNDILNRLDALEQSELTARQRRQVEAMRFTIDYEFLERQYNFVRFYVVVEKDRLERLEKSILGK